MDIIGGTMSSIYGTTTLVDGTMSVGGENMHIYGIMSIISETLSNIGGTKRYVY